MTTINLRHCREQVNGRVLYVQEQKKVAVADYGPPEPQYR